MSFYRRFFSYLYAYEQNQKTGSAGFAKIEIRDQTTCLELHMRTSRQAEHAHLYLFVRTGDSIQGFPLGDVSLIDGCANRRFTMDQTRLGESEYEIGDAAGILLTCEEKISFVSQWDEAPVNWESFRVYEKTESSDETEENHESQIPVSQTDEGGEAEDHETKNIETSADLRTEELAIPEPILTITPERSKRPSSWPAVWEELLNTLPPMCPFSDNRIRCVKAELKDLRLLPASNWHLGSNSFLLRSFFTHRYLLIGELPRPHRWFLGVPGIRYRQEHVMAAIFGFSDFLPDKNSAGEAPFGYWIIPISESD